MPILDVNALEYFSRSPDQTRRLGMRLGALIEPGQTVYLSGELGSGKTTLVQGIAQGWGSTDQVTSPSFVLINEYHRPDGAVLFHLDAYRLQNSLEGEALDIDGMLSQGTLVVEWPENILSALPEEALAITMRWMADEQRGLVLTPRGKNYQDLLADIRQQVYGGY
ncbi:MAG: tRNA (adenosine(37)-N6)-threonylcarbamoyltransferase complex ATPase subunit type 1 TsaE [Anaerolineaceae bacterium]|nr:tRNA (adenosine(37)-N6)-threonylcarbamoyltransferase complex ATPase subunit type 1 TsaE [Anaerolineaceae bacterium]